MKEKIKNWLKINWFKIGLLVLLVTIIGGAFYWNEIRPARIYSKCRQEAADAAKDLLKTKVELGGTEYSKVLEKGLFLRDDYEHKYKDCLRKYGIYR